MFENINENNRNNICLIRITLNEGYEWGQGWTPGSMPIRFDHKIKQLATELHENLLVPDNGGGRIGSCMEICNSYNLNLYCHPMDLSGYCRVSDIEKIVNACRTVGLNVVHISYDPDRALYDEATVVISYFTDQYKDIIDYIDRLLHKYKSTTINARIIKDSVHNRFLVNTKEHHCGHCSDQPTCVALDRIVDDHLKSLNDDSIIFN